MLRKITTLGIGVGLISSVFYYAFSIIFFHCYKHYK
jgi:hypothetical protein